MRLLAATLFSFCLIVSGAAAAKQAPTEGAKPMSKSEDIRAVAPALENYAQIVVVGDLWKRPVSPLETAASSRSRPSSLAIRRSNFRTISVSRSTTV